MALDHALNLDAANDDAGHCATRLRAQLGADARVGAVGFCLGGRLAVLAALRGQVQAAEAYYPVRLDAQFPELPAALVPLLLYFREDDPWIPAATVAGVVQALAGCVHAAVEIYPGGRARLCPRRLYSPFHAPAAALARRRGLVFLRLNLATARG
jgi:carboxymethylenebutenolidase